VASLRRALIAGGYGGDGPNSILGHLCRELRKTLVVLDKSFHVLADEGTLNERASR
jgi:hypothetical protein